MKVFVDLDALQLVGSASNLNPIAGINLRRGDNTNVDVYFTQSGSVVSLGTGATVRFAAKEDGKYDAPLILSGSTGSVTSSGNWFYRIALDCNTSELNTLLGFNSGSTTFSSNDVESVELTGEISYVKDTTEESTRPFTVTAENDLYRGDEGDPASANAYPSDNFILALQVFS